MLGRPSVKRWAAAVTVAVNLPEDPRTVRTWSRSIGLCETQLRVTCRMAGFSAKASLDFARLLRAVVLQQNSDWSLGDYLDLADGRTLSRLLSRAGVDDGPRLTPAVFLTTQRLVRGDAALTEISERLDSYGHEASPPGFQLAH
jgi:hypothetical protein